MPYPPHHTDTRPARDGGPGPYPTGALFIDYVDHNLFVKNIQSCFVDFMEFFRGRRIWCHVNLYLKYN